MLHRWNSQFFLYLSFDADSFECGIKGSFYEDVQIYSYLNLIFREGKEGVFNFTYM